MNFSLTDFTYKDALWFVRGTCSEYKESLITLVGHCYSDTSPSSRIQSAKDTSSQYCGSRLIVVKNIAYLLAKIPKRFSSIPAMPKIIYSSFPGQILLKKWSHYKTY